jgi:hypothetical protein
MAAAAAKDWVPDEVSNNCFKCNAEFGFFNRKVPRLPRFCVAVNHICAAYSHTHCIYIHPIHLLSLSPPQYPYLSHSHIHTHTHTHTHTHYLLVLLSHTSHSLCLSLLLFVRIRQHHCRSCSLLLCHACSSKSIALPTKGMGSLERVCDYCFAYETRRLAYHANVRPYREVGEIEWNGGMALAISSLPFLSSCFSSCFFVFFFFSSSSPSSC